ncbi:MULTISPECIES: shikimate kinase [Terrabacteria group]|uniref:shikimate kinase n=1 Tax=Bacillati TaxID=1783272 RepID=UPI001C6E6C48|nr:MULTISPECIES: shikimate kinase [Terrabacteria group]MBW9212169.1 hypothetical protein [Trueperella sp. zg.1013]
MARLGLIGHPLHHSMSSFIHHFFLNKEYQLWDISEQELASFIQEEDSLNVTIPYKEKVLSLLKSLSKEAKEIGAVNTIHHCIGYNTDASAFADCLKVHGFKAKKKRVLVLGTGGVSKAIRYVLKKEGAVVQPVSRSKKDNAIAYEEIKDMDYQAIVNCTPVGMFPRLNESLTKYLDFSKVEWLVDVIANPMRTKLLQEAPCPSMSGLEMLVRQAAKADEIFFGVDINEKQIQSCLKALCFEQRNIVFIGMATSGKSTIAKAFNKEALDMDAIIEKREGLSINCLFQEKGEVYFRKKELEVAKELALSNHQVIATGGGIVLNEEAMTYLRANGILIWVKRDVDKMILDNHRPLYPSKKKLYQIYAERKELYAKYADIELDNNSSIAETIFRLKEKIK